MSGGDEYRIDLGQVEEFAKVLDQFVKYVEDRVGALDARIDELHVSWTGEAAVAHRDAHERWRAGAAEMNEAVADIRKSADHSHAAFSGVQELHRRMWP